MPDQQQFRATVLVVEDEPLVRWMLADHLRADGLLVVEASVPHEALRYLAAGGAADLLITDINMPGTMDGVEMARIIKAQRPRLPIIVTSANHDDGTIGSVGVFVAKPYNLETLTSFVQHSLRQEGDGATHRSDRRG